MLKIEKMVQHAQDQKNLVDAETMKTMTKQVRNKEYFYQIVNILL